MNRKNSVFLIAATIILLSPFVFAGQVIYVDDDAPGPVHDGSTWNNAFVHLQDALAAAQSGDEIRVGQGIYVPDRDSANPGGTGTREAVFQIRSGLHIAGGYAGFGAIDPGDRNTQLFETVLSGDLAQNDESDFTNNEENCYTVVKATDTSDNTILDGFVIEGGNANGNNEFNHGGGIRIVRGSLHIVSCTCQNNSAKYGGGIWNQGGDATIRSCGFRGNVSTQGGGIQDGGSSVHIVDCWFRENTASGSGPGGGLASYESNASIDNCTFERNLAWHGGGLAAIKGNVSVNDCVFEENEALVGGGGFYSNDGDPVVEDCSFRFNEAVRGGGIHIDGGHSRINSCVIDGNQSQYGAGICNYGTCTVMSTEIMRNQGGMGGGMYNQNPSESTVLNCVFYHNSATVGGAIRNSYDSTQTLTNCTMWWNTASQEGGGISSPYGSNVLNLTNCILWENSDEYGDGEESQISSITAVINNSCIQKWTGLLGGNGNFGTSPMFMHDDPIGAGDVNLRLQSESPCCDSGDNLALPVSVTFDMDGMSRYSDNPDANDIGAGQPPIVDLGAYEYHTDTAVLGINPIICNFNLFNLSTRTSEQTLHIRNRGGGVLGWSVSETCSWLEITPSSGESFGEVDDVILAVDATDLQLGVHSCEILIESPGALTSPRTMPVYLRVGPLMVPDEFATLEAAILAAKNGDVIQLAIGTHILEGGLVTVSNKHLVFQSEDPNDPSVVEQTIVEGKIAIEDQQIDGTRSIIWGLTVKGIECTHASPLIEKCTIADSVSGGIVCDQASPLIRHCSVLRNERRGFNATGGGICVLGDESNPVIENCLIESNYVDCYGGGIGVKDGGRVSVFDSVIRNNESDGSGGGIYGFDGAVFVARCRIEGNDAGAYGGGVSRLKSLVNSLVINNSHGGVNDCDVVMNCTVVGNSNIEFSAGISTWDGVIANCIVWGNTSSEGTLEEQQVSLGDGGQRGHLDNSCLQGWTGSFGGWGNMGDDPMFVGAGDYHLQIASQCVDAGGTFISDPRAHIDLDGNGRVKDGNGDLIAVIDMGAYEIGSASSAALVASIQQEFSFEAFEARENPIVQTLAVVNGGIGSLNWSVSEVCNWLTVAPDSGIVGEIGVNLATVGVDITGMDMGDHACDIVISDPDAGNSPVTIPVSLHITGPIFNLSSDSFDIYAEHGGLDPDAVIMTVENTGGGNLDWALTVDCSWLEATPPSGIVAEEGIEVSLQARLGELPIGVHTCELTFSDPRAENGSQVVSVRVHVRGLEINMPADTDDVATAIDLVLDGGTIIIEDGTYIGAGPLNPTISGKGAVIRSQNGPDNCIIDFKGQGQGFRLFDSQGKTIVIEGLTILNAQSEGIRAWANSNPTIQDCVIKNCYRGIFAEDTPITIRNCRIVNNRALGIYVESMHTPVIANCIITGNDKEGIELNTYGAVIRNCLITWNGRYAITYTPRVFPVNHECIIRHCTIANNDAGIQVRDSSALIENSILWDNDRELWSPNYEPPQGLIVRNCYIDGGWEGENVLTDDPLLTLDGHLKNESPCIDHAIPFGSDPAYDVDDEPRPEGAASDIGADEYIDSDLDRMGDWWEQQYFVSIVAAEPNEDSDSDGWPNLTEYEYSSNPFSTIYYVDASRPDDSGDGLTWQSAKKTIQPSIDQAGEHDVVLVSDGVYDISNGGLTFRGKKVAVCSVSGPSNCIIDCGGSNSVYFLEGETLQSVLDGFTVTGADSHTQGAIDIQNSGATITNCVVHGNGREGISFDYARVVITDCVIVENAALGIGAIQSDMIIRGCDLSRNGGGGIGFNSCSATIEDCLITGITDTGWARAALSLTAGEDDNIRISGCTIADNHRSRGGLTYSGHADVTVENCIFWNNGQEIDVTPDEDAEFVVRYCDVSGGYSGIGNMDETPWFVDPANGDYRLLSISPCINSGDPNYVAAEGDVDIDGVRRVIYGRVDMGAYETVSADSVNDGEINMHDLASFASNWFAQGCVEPGWCDWADLTLDGIVDFDDLAQFAGEWALTRLGPVAYLRFDETTGTLAADSSLFGRDSTLTNMDDSDWVQGKVGNGNALEFDGVDDFVEITGFTGVLGSQSRAVCAWIRTNTPGSVIIAWGQPDFGGLWQVLVEPAGRLRIQIYGGNIVGSTSVNDGTWHHVAVVLEDDGSPNINEVKLYVDGLPDELSSNTTDREINTLPGPDVTIGQYLGTSFFEGTIDEVRIYDRALTAAEIAALAQ